MAERAVFSVGELSRHIRNALEKNFSDIWVEGEISNFTAHSSGHFYFSIKDSRSQLKCVMFRHANKNLKFRLEDGLQIITHGAVSVYEKRGDYQLIIDIVEPRGRGALQLAFEQLKEKLGKEGLFNPEIKKKIPLLPGIIGIVTSPTGAAIKDILNVLERRFSSVNVLINPVRVQGEGAGEEIARAITELDTLTNADVIIVARGGGSIEDLWAFNEETVARSIFRCSIPVISAVGHEIDYTISDFAADLRAPTPSAAAELVIAEREKLIERVRVFENSIIQSMEQGIGRFKDKVNFFRTGYGFRRFEDKLRQNTQIVDELRSGLFLRISHLAQVRKKTLENLAGKLSTLGPESVLKRGYSITLKLPGEEVITDARKVKPGSRVRIMVARGSFYAEVVKKGETNEI